MFGMLKGVVKDNIDPSRLGRIKVLIPALSDTTVSDWALPCVQPNQVGTEGQALPAVGSHVWIAFENGDDTHPIWLGCFYTRSDETPAVLQPLIGPSITQ